MNNAESAAAANFARRQFAFSGPLSFAVWRYLPTTAIGAVALLIAARRLGGAVSRPLSLEAAAVTSLVATLAALAAALNPAATRASRLPAVPCLLLIAGCLTTRGASAFSTVLLFLPALVATACEFALPRRDGPRRETLRDLPSKAPIERFAAARPNCTAETVRYVDTDGRDTLEGTFVVPLEVGRRTAAVHIAFCPPFARTPTVEASVVGEASRSTNVQLKTTSVLPYAARVEIRASSPTAAATSVRVRVVAREALQMRSIEDAHAEPPR